MTTPKLTKADRKRLVFMAREHDTPNGRAVARLLARHDAPAALRPFATFTVTIEDVQRARALLTED